MRLGPIQKKLVQWVRENGRTHIGAASKPPAHLGLGGYSMDEVGPALDRLVARRILARDKGSFYSMRAPLPAHVRERLTGGHIARPDDLGVEGKKNG